MPSTTVQEMERAIEELKPERTPGGHPFFQSLFIYQAEDLQGAAPGNLTWRHDFMERVGAKFDFTLTIEEQAGRTTGFVEFGGAGGFACIGHQDDYAATISRARCMRRSTSRDGGKLPCVLTLHVA